MKSASSLGLKFICQAGTADNEAGMGVLKEQMEKKGCQHLQGLSSLSVFSLSLDHSLLSVF